MFRTANQLQNDGAQNNMYFNFQISVPNNKIKNLAEHHKEETQFCSSQKPRDTFKQK